MSFIWAVDLNGDSVLPATNAQCRVFRCSDRVVVVPPWTLDPHSAEVSCSAADIVFVSFRRALLAGDSIVCVWQ